MKSPKSHATINTEQMFRKLGGRLLQYDQNEYKYRIYLNSTLCSIEEMIDVTVLNQEEYFLLLHQSNIPKEGMDKSQY